MNGEVPAYLSRCPLFRGLESERLEAILGDIECRMEKYSAGALIRQQGSVYDRLIFLVAGRLEARFVSTSGRTLTVEHMDMPTMVASAILMSSEPVLPVTLSAETDVVLVTVNRRDMLKLLAAETAVLEAFLEDTGDKVRFLAEKLRLQRFSSLRVKIAEHLLSQSAQRGCLELRWRYGREQMAELLGVARPSLSRELSRMADQGLIEMPDRSTVRLNVAGLRALTEED